MFNGRDHCEYGLSQWEMLLQCNGISHWLCSYPQWSLNGPARSMSSLLLWNCNGHISEQVEFFTLCPRLWRFSWPGMGVTKLIFFVPLCLLVFFFFCLILLKLVLGWTIGLWDGGRRFHFICQHWFRIYAAMVSINELLLIFYLRNIDDGSYVYFQPFASQMHIGKSSFDFINAFMHALKSL